ncbi:MAG: hypothetical protein ABI239_04585 [Aquihabitans sp.]
MADQEIAPPADQADVALATDRIDATEVTFPWVWTLVGLTIVVVAVVLALVTESQGIGLR